MVTVVFVAVGAYLGHHTWRTAQDNARDTAAFLAGVAADAFEDSHAIAEERAIELAANPAVPGLLAEPTACAFHLQLELFPRAHVDLTTTDGRVVCTSATDGGATSVQPVARGAGHTSGVTRTSVFRDGVTGLAAIAFVSPVLDAGGRPLGNVAVVLPVRATSQLLADILGGARGYEFAFVDAEAERVLSVSQGLADALRAEDAPPDLDDPLGGSGFLRGSAPAEGTPWVVSAGVDADVALAPTRSVLLRGALLGVAVLGALLLSIRVVGKRITDPLRDLAAAVDDGRPDTPDLLASVQGPSEITDVANHLRNALAARDTYEAQLSHQALHDPLTGLPNRALLSDRLADAVDRAVRDGRTAAVFFVDIDRFKLVNDSLGHDTGDRVLVEVADRLRSCLPPGATLARFGGDSFVVVHHVDDDGHVDALADELLAVVDEPVAVGDTVLRVTASIGIVTSGAPRAATELVRDADSALHAAKESGRGRALRFDERLHRRASASLTLATEFRGALERDELHLAYQPKVELRTGAIVGVEALLRWTHPRLGAVPPGTFVPVAEESGSIVAVGAFVLREACRQAVAWRDQGIDLTVAVNVSGRQLTDIDLPVQVASVVAETGIEPARLYLELTESLLMSDTMRTQRTVERLHELGVRLSIDDFGTGYSSLAYLHRFPVDELKIDRAFVTALDAPGARMSLVPAVVAMGRALGLATVAEGVETTHQADRLRRLGCHLAQGYLYAKPQPPDDVAALAARRVIDPLPR